jgi:pantoate--beta-alanine ligase
MSQENCSQQREGATALPQIVTSGEQVRQLVQAARQQGKSVGFVPTMGALHEGHLTLIDAARAECDVAVVSIFVNPTQFGPQEDFRRYPRDLERDMMLLGGRGCDFVFTPGESQMYSADHATYVDVGPLGQVLEGEFRPTHFRGVATIVLKLFQFVPADRAYFGRKDYQQTVVVRQMVADLNVPIDIRVCPTMREPDGLAMSSRNVYLSADERRRAVVLSQSLRLAEQSAAKGECDIETIRQKMLANIERVGGVDVQYIAFVSEGTLSAVERISGPTTVVIAATVGKTRLIDNVLIGGQNP